jgi:hypothetical protein
MLLHRFERDLVLQVFPGKGGVPERIMRVVEAWSILRRAKE